MATEQLDRIISLTEFSVVFDELKRMDAKRGAEIEMALRESVKASCKGLSESKTDNSALRYWLYRHSVELRAHTSSYLSYSEMMATREAALWKFALGSTDQFFQLIFDALAEYFEAKKEVMLQEIDRDAVWYSDLRDTAKKVGLGLNLAKKLLKTAADAVDLGDKISAEDIVVDTNTIVEELLNMYLPPELVSSDVARIMEEANKRYQSAWEQEIKTQTPDLEKIRLFAARYAEGGQPAVAFEIGVAEQTFAAGIGGAIAGTIGLAAGFHTLTYALLHVFPPAALFVAVATVSVAWLSQDKAKERRGRKISDTVNEYHKMLLLQIDTGKMEPLGDKTLREAVLEQGRTLVSDTVKRWQEAISGQLTIEHYRRLIAVVQAHLTLVNSCLDALEKVPNADSRDDRGETFIRTKSEHERVCP